MRKKILIVLALLLVGGLAIHFHRSGGPRFLESLRRSVHGVVTGGCRAGCLPGSDSSRRLLDARPS